MVLAVFEYVAERGSGSPSTSRPWPVTSSEWSGHGWTGCWSHRLPWRPLPPLHEATGVVASPLMPTLTGYGAPQRPHRPQHNPRPEQTKSLTPNRPHAAEPTRKALVTRESRLRCGKYLRGEYIAPESRRLVDAQMDAGDADETAIDNGAVRVRKAPAMQRRKPAPLQTARWNAVQKAKRRGLSIRGSPGNSASIATRQRSTWKL